MNKKNKSGFISMTLVYTFLVLFMFIMLAILRTYAEKDRYLQAINDQIDSDISNANVSRVVVINKIIDQNMPSSDANSGIRLFKISNSLTGNGNSLFYMDRLNEEYDLLEHTDENADGHTSRIYYFRGNVENNHIVFANMCFRLIRTNEDGSLRLRYNGSYNASGTQKCMSTSDVAENISSISIGQTTFSETEGSNSYSLSSLPNSPVMRLLNDWYYNNIVCSTASGTKVCSEKYTSYISRFGVYCSKNSTELAPTFINQAEQFENDYNMKNNVSLKCESEYRYVQGDGKTLYPVGLVTAQDIVLAGGYLYTDEDIYKGGSSGITNTDYYMYAGAPYWTMSAYGTDGTMLYVDGGSGNGETYGALLKSSPGVERHVIPVISIGPNVSIASGTGTTSNPFIVRE